MQLFFCIYCRICARWLRYLEFILRVPFQAASKHNSTRRQRALVAQCCNLSCETLLFGWMDLRSLVWCKPDCDKSDRLKVTEPFYYSATAPGRWICRKNEARSVAGIVERKVAGSIPREDVFAFSVLNLTIMLYSVHVPILSLLCAIIVVIVAVLHHWWLWKFHFRNKGLVPIFKKNTIHHELLYNYYPMAEV